jgi:hypothetical protein
VKIRLITAGSALSCPNRRDILKGCFIRITTDKIKTFPFPDLRIPSPCTLGQLSATLSCRVTSQTDEDLDIFISKYLTRRYRKSDRHRKCVVLGQTSVQIATRDNSNGSVHTHHKVHKSTERPFLPAICVFLAAV